jgi:hypothetical protein
LKSGPDRNKILLKTALLSPTVKEDGCRITLKVFVPILSRMEEIRKQKKAVEQEDWNTNK